MKLIPCITLAEIRNTAGHATGAHNRDDNTEFL